MSTFMHKMMNFEKIEICIIRRLNEYIEILGYFGGFGGVGGGGGGAMVIFFNIY